jgi:hypothetical protein
MVLNMIRRCSECGKRRKLYHAVGSTINALWCANCIAKHKEAIETVYEINEEPHQYCADCGKRLTVKEILDSLEIIGVAVCKRDLNRRMDW